MNIMPDVVDAQLRLQFLGRDVMLPSVMASDPAHDPNTFSVEALIRANLILAMMVTLSSKLLLSIEPRYLNSSTTGASPSPILIGRIA